MSNGQINREAYKNSRQKHIKLVMEPWAKMSDECKADWEAGAQAVLDAQPCVHPWGKLTRLSENSDRFVCECGLVL